MVLLEDNILEVNNLSAAYKEDIILQTISFKVGKGRFIGLSGSNGSGKTTLLKILSGEMRQRSGTIRYKNKVLDYNGIVPRMRSGIIYLHQQPIVFRDLYAWENFAIWSSVLGGTGTRGGLTKKAILADLNKKLSDLDLAIPLEKKTTDLSEGELQILEFCRCFINTPELILVDETTSVLDSYISNKILNYLKAYCSGGGSVIFVSHRLTELQKYSDMIIELKNKVLNTSLSSDSQPSADPEPSDLPRHGSFDKNKPALQVHIPIPEKKDPFSLELYQGEVLGITGLDGSWYENLSRLILNTIRYSGAESSGKDKGSGNIRRPRRKWTIGKDFAFLGKKRQTDWIFPLQTVGFNLAITLDQRSVLRQADAAELEEQIRYFKIVPTDPAKPADELSGGNKLKTAIARTLLLRCPVNLFDEPFTGIDFDSRAGIAAIIRTAAGQDNRSFIVFSKEYKELIRLCDRILAFKNDGSCKEFTYHDFPGIGQNNPETALFN